MDTVPGSQYKIFQGPGAFSYSVDSLFLSAFARLKGDVLDLGCGPGILFFRGLNPGVKSYLGIDINPQALAYFRQSLAYNACPLEVQLQEKSILDLQDPGRFDSVICNPPYYQGYLKTKDTTKNLSKHEETLGLRDFILKGAFSLKPLGSMYFVLPSHRLADAICFCREGKAEVKRLQFLAKKRDQGPHWVSIEARKSAKPHLIVEAPLNLEDHKDLIYRNLLGTKDRGL